MKKKQSDIDEDEVSGFLKGLAVVIVVAILGYVLYHFAEKHW